MRATRETIREWHRINRLSEGDIFMTLVLGTWRCPLHNVSLETKCSECHNRVCQFCLEVAQESNCETCGAKFLGKTNVVRPRCCLCRSDMEYECLVIRGVPKELCDQCDSTTQMCEDTERCSNLGIEVFNALRNQGICERSVTRCSWLSPVLTSS